MREIVLDTETTGLDPDNGHRIVEVACLELVNHLPTGRSYQSYVNPDRDMPSEAFAVHGLSAEFLSDKPRFAEVADALMGFVGESPLVIHNAEFDIRFLNAELRKIERPLLTPDRVVDTLQIARQKFPGAPASLDALCRRFAIDNSAREKHGALLDVELLADVYLELIGGRQAGLQFSSSPQQASTLSATTRPRRPARPHAPSAEELAAHGALVGELKNPIWSR